ncbi:hypothetical protein CXB51_031160 [Gossypium anomalum]|uniref:Integrase catalytic domain-containing protein n=1 Tax=Gossypium anomalum TaxID=47600 RepID=A0A8J6CKS6_9ROSI|nr:hypothetical protein CXB51_031160 [Gossypium anomalum]
MVPIIFGIWQCEILDVLCQQELDIDFEEKPNKMDDKEWAKINRQAYGTICLCLAKEQKYSVIRETSVKKLWDTLEEKFLTKSLENRLYMKKKLYRYTYAPGMSMNDHTRKKDKRDHRDTAAEVLIVRGRSHNNKSGRKSKSKRRPAKDECTFCREKEYWKKNCPKLQKGKAISDACVVEHDEESDFSLVGMAMDWFSSLKVLEGGVVFMGNDSACKTIGAGTIQLKNHDGSIHVLTNVPYVPSLKKNLIILEVLQSKGLTITLRDGLLKVVAGVLTVMKGTRRNNWYYLNGSIVIGSTSIASVKDADSEATRLWHMRLGHAGEKALQNLAKQGLLKGANSYKLEFYEHCVLGKQTRVKFSLAIHNTKGILDYIHSDLWGPTKVASLKMVETQTGRKVKRLRSDNGTEYKNDPYLQVCQNEGIVRHFTVQDTPQQNGVAECMNQTIPEKVRSMLFNAGLGKKFWAEAVTYACHLINRLPLATINGKTPMEMWTGKPATDYDSLHVFGSTIYYHVKESKLEPRAKKALFVGITSGVKGYRLWCPNTKKIVFSRDVELGKVNDDPANIERTNVEEVSTQELLQQQDLITYRRPRREIRMSAHFDDMVADRFGMPKNPQKWPFPNWTQLRLGRDTLVCNHFRSCSSLLDFHGRVFYPCESFFDTAKLTRPCELPV